MPYDVTNPENKKYGYKVVKASQLETKANKVNSINETSTEDQYPSAKAVFDALKTYDGGEDTVAGCKGYYIFDANVDNKTITLSTQRRYKLDPSSETGYREYVQKLPKKTIINKLLEKVTLHGESINQYVTFDVGTTYTFTSKVVGVDKDTGTITLDNIPFTQSTFNSSIINIERMEGTDFTLYSPLCPENGEVVLTDLAFAQGTGSVAGGHGSMAVNRDTNASGAYSFAANKGTVAGYGASSFGSETKALGNHSLTSGHRTLAGVNTLGAHAEGCNTKVLSGEYGHSEGNNTQVGGKDYKYDGVTYNPSSSSVENGQYAHAEGNGTKAIRRISHAEGENTVTLGIASHAEGKDTVAVGMGAHAEGSGTVAYGGYSHVQGKFNVKDTTDTYAHIVGNGTSDSARSNAHTVDWNGNGWFAGDVTVGSGKKKLVKEDNLAVSKGRGTGSVVSNDGENTATGNYSSAFGYKTTASGEGAHAEGSYYDHTVTDDDGKTSIQRVYNSATNRGSHAEGVGTKSDGTGSHAEGGYTTASLAYAHAEGFGTVASGARSHTEGTETIATHQDAHAEGYRTQALGNRAHAEGHETTAKAYAHSEGVGTYAEGNGAHAEGVGTYATKLGQHVQGKYNKVTITKDEEGNIISRDAGNYAHIIGGGSGDKDRDNIHTVDWSGNAVYKGSITFNGNQKISSTHTITFEFLDGSTPVTLKIAEVK